MCRGNIPDNTPVHTHYREDGGTRCHGAPDPLVRQDRNWVGSRWLCLRFLGRVLTNSHPQSGVGAPSLTSCLACLQRALVYLTQAGERTSQARLCRQKGPRVAADQGGLLSLCSPPQRVTHTDQYGRTCPHCFPPLESLCLCHVLGDKLPWNTDSSASHLVSKEQSI